MTSLIRFALWSTAFLLSFAGAAAEVLDPAGVEFFESKIRPVLAENCYQCHSQKAEKLKGGLYLDSRDGVLTGGEHGPAITPGDPEKSLMIRAIRYTDDDLQMPPKNKKLSSEQIADFETWVKMGAPDPRTQENTALTERVRKQKNHWAFQPIRRPEIPVLDDPWVQTPVDAFVLARLQAEGMHPAPRADKRTLIRRATFGLTGLPPKPEEVEAFVNDPSDKAWEKVVDRLLASPEYGECWARHWLDVARYADTKGYVFEEERRYPYSYTYRDYVIRAFNEDLPFDRFIIEQLAADLLPLGDDKRPLAAMGYLTLGRRFLNSQPDIIDDRIDVVTRGMMGLTVACARCHDHKYDPIPTADYYSLYGVFASSSEPAEKPLLGDSSLPKEYPAYKKEREKRLREQEEFREKSFAEVRQQLRDKAADYLLAAFDARDEEKADIEKLAKERKLHPGTVRKWVKFLEERRKMEFDPIFAPWFAFASLPESDFAAKAGSIVQRFANDGENPAINPQIRKAFAGAQPGSMKEVAEKYREIFAEIQKSWTEASKNHKDKLDDLDQEKVRELLYAESSPAAISDSEIPRLFDVPTAQKTRALQRKLEELDATHPGAPPRGMVLKENDSPTTPHIFVRGNARNPGDEVPRQFLSLIAGPDRKPFQHGSGRLEMAEAIASPDNPLTSRVLVNRVWLNHFGAALVRTPSDFGIRSDPPTHPLLLDFLASWFMDQGWSLKKLHRLILLSSAYQQSSEENEAYAKKDPNNNLIWHMNRRRLEFEPFRDTLLATSGELDLTQGGHPVEITTQPFTTRRTVYSFIERQNLPGLFRTFDFASPDTTSARRFNTTVPQQALFMINSPFVAEQARSLIQRPDIAAAPGDEKIVRLYELAFQRPPQPEELELAHRFLEQQAKLPDPEPPVQIWQYGYGELDPRSHQLLHFEKLPHFTGQAWQGGDKLPDPQLGWLTLNAAGGHPDGGLTRAVVRRWTAPRDGAISISGALEHPAEAGDGVRGTIVSSRLGALGFWPVYHGKRDMHIPRVEVKEGDHIDFVVDCLGDINSDSFNWAPRIKAISGPSETWNAQEQFSGPPEPWQPLTPWERYAQVLLMSNELAFVD